MNDPKTRAGACELLGCSDRELVSIDETPAGVLYHTIDGNALLLVPDATPDFGGKTGLMFAHAPVLDGRAYSGGFPVFTPFPDDEADAATAAEAAAADDGGAVVDLAELDKKQLIAHGAAQDPPVWLDMKQSKPDMLQALADAATAAEALAAGDGGAE